MRMPMRDESFEDPSAAYSILVQAALVTLFRQIYLSDGLKDLEKSNQIALDKNKLIKP